MYKVVAILETMWDWRSMTSGAGYKESPRFFKINPHNFTGRRLYRLVGKNVKLLVTESCRDLVCSAKYHGKPDPLWLKENLFRLEPFDLLLICGRVAKKTYRASKYRSTAPLLFMLHPAARTWTNVQLDSTSKKIQRLLCRERRIRPCHNSEVAVTR